MYKDPNLPKSVDYYVAEFKEPRERWLRGYFNWTDEEDITDAERHTARDGFDSGATYMERQTKEKAQQFAKFLLESEMKLAQAFSDPSSTNLPSAFTWVNLIRHEFKEKFL